MTRLHLTVLTTRNETLR